MYTFTDKFSTLIFFNNDRTTARNIITGLLFKFAEN